jgi:hypothetical protein
VDFPLQSKLFVSFNSGEWKGRRGGSLVGRACRVVACADPDFQRGIEGIALNGMIGLGNQTAEQEQQSAAFGEKSQL